MTVLSLLATALLAGGALGVTDHVFTCDAEEDLTCKTDGPCPPCDATDRDPAVQRVRRDVMTLSDEEWQKVVDAMWIMKTTSIEDGVEQYGDQFKPYDYFIARHIYAVTDTRGDQGHSTDSFATWHGAFVLEFEESLLSIDPEIGALPYWEVTSGEAMNDKYFGSTPGTGKGNTVVDGAFANWPMNDYHHADYAPFMKEVEGVSSQFLPVEGRVMRGQWNAKEDRFVVRDGPGSSYKDFDGCALFKGCWGHWIKCIETGMVDSRPIADAGFHGGTHGSIGGGWKFGTCGDFSDVATSPSDFIFMFFHANVDRQRFKFMEVNKEKRDYYWGYPTTGIHVPEPPLGATGPPPSNDMTKKIRNDPRDRGVGLNDPMSSLFPFSSKMLGLDDILQKDVLTNADIVCHLNPFTAPYRYEDITCEERKGKIACKAGKGCFYSKGEKKCKQSECPSDTEYVTKGTMEVTCELMKTKQDCSAAGCKFKKGKCRFSKKPKCKKVKGDCCSFKGCMLLDGMCQGKSEGIQD